MSDKKITRTVVVHAPAGRVFDLLADPSKHPLIDGSGTVKAPHGAQPERLELGSRFGMNMRLGAPYRVTNRVVEYEKDRLIAWRHFGGHRWRWELKPIDDETTEVSETFDWSTAPGGFAYGAIGFLDRNTKGIEATLAKLDSVLAEH
ncbi:MAG TPA: SRPBCC family protein [Pseudonocardiaceae bacterium]|nr:SRPBCC family protein [Pseudonocardiaceae bacterium]